MLTVRVESSRLGGGELESIRWSILNLLSETAKLQNIFLSDATKFIIRVPVLTQFFEEEGEKKSEIIHVECEFQNLELTDEEASRYRNFLYNLAKKIAVFLKNFFLGVQIRCEIKSGTRTEILYTWIEDN